VNEFFVSNEPQILINNNGQTFGVIYPDYDSFKNECKFEKVTGCGYVYVFEIDDVIKIGKTINPNGRILCHNLNSKMFNKSELKRIFVSTPHPEYSNTEKVLHHKYYAINELAEAPLDDLIVGFSEIKITFDIDSFYLDEHLNFLKKCIVFFKWIQEQKISYNDLHLLQKFNYDDYYKYIINKTQALKYTPASHTGETIRFGKPFLINHTNSHLFSHLFCD